MAKSKGDTGGQAWLAKQLGISQPRISQLINGEDWPFGRGPWKQSQLFQIKAHIADRRASNNATSGSDDDDVVNAISRNPEKIARIKLVIERTAKIKLERELLAGGYIRKEDHEKELLARIYATKAKMMEIPLRAHLVANKSEAECEGVLKEWMREVCDAYANGGN